jgi:hypothetical protein
MQTKFNTNGTTVSVFQLNPDQLKDSLAPRIYSVGFSKMSGYFLNIESDNFNITSKIYGNTYSKVDKAFNTYQTRTKNTGIILTGDKGSGKSIYSQVMANKFIDNGIPVVVVQEAFYGDAFNSFIASLGNCILIFDEFAKTYADGDGNSIQDKLLTLFDGATGSLNDNKIMFIIIENYHRSLDQFLMDRPGRFFYHLQYGKLPEDVIREYCTDNNVSSTFIDEIISFSKLTLLLGYDILYSIVEEHLRLPNESFESIVEDMNITYDPNTIEYHVLKLLDQKTNQEVPVKTTVLNSTKGNLAHVVKDDSTLRSKPYFDSGDIAFEEGNIVCLDIHDSYSLFLEKRTKIKFNYAKYLTV